MDDAKLKAMVRQATSINRAAYQSKYGMKSLDEVLFSDSKTTLLDVYLVNEPMEQDDDEEDIETGELQGPVRPLFKLRPSKLKYHLFAEEAERMRRYAERGQGFMSCVEKCRRRAARTAKLPPTEFEQLKIVEPIKIASRKIRPFFDKHTQPLQIDGAKPRTNAIKNAVRRGLR